MLTKGPLAAEERHRTNALSERTRTSAPSPRGQYQRPSASQAGGAVKITTAFSPPKANEFDIAQLTFMDRPTFGT